MRSMSSPVHAFGDDALGLDDGLGLAARLAKGEVSRHEVLEAALARAEAVRQLNAVETLDAYRAHAFADEQRVGPFSGVPTFVKDNTDLAGLATGHGSEGIVAKPAGKDAGFTRLIRDSGLVPLGKSRLPEFGFNASTEFMTAEPVRNPWNVDYSTGASSGGAAALVAAGVVPLAHANDGGGSIRIPAAACGLVGLKVTRGRYHPAPLDRLLPVRLAVEGVLTRSVRDTAHFLAATEQGRHRVGLVEGPSTKRLRIGMVLDSVVGEGTDEATVKTVLATSELLSSLGHDVFPVASPMDEQFAEDFKTYWGMLGLLAVKAGPRAFSGWDPERLDTLTVGLAAYARARRRTTAGVVRRLRASAKVYARALDPYDAILTPVVAHATPLLGYLSPAQDFEVLFDRLIRYACFSPLNNATGSPAVSLPMGATRSGLPIGVQLMGRHDGERTLLELAYELEAAKPFRTIHASASQPASQ